MHTILAIDLGQYNSVSGHSDAIRAARRLSR